MNRTGENSTNRLVQHLRGNTVAYLALFVALGGTSYAAFSLPAGSVGARQLKNHSILPVKLDPKFIAGSVRAWAVVGSDGRVVAGGGGPKASANAPYPGAYVVKWSVPTHGSCATDVTVDSNRSPITEHIPVMGNPSAGFTAGYAVAYSTGQSGRTTSAVNTFDQQGRLTPLGFDVAIIC
jgi:hypothetical protein